MTFAGWVQQPVSGLGLGAWLARIYAKTLKGRGCADCIGHVGKNVVNPRRGRLGKFFGFIVPKERHSEVVGILFGETIERRNNARGEVSYPRRIESIGDNATCLLSYLGERVRDTGEVYRPSGRVLCRIGHDASASSVQLSFSASSWRSSAERSIPRRSASRSAASVIEVGTRKVMRVVPDGESALVAMRLTITAKWVSGAHPCNSSSFGISTHSEGRFYSL